MSSASESSEPAARPRKRYKLYTYIESDSEEPSPIPRETLRRHEPPPSPQNQADADEAVGPCNTPIESPYLEGSSFPLDRSMHERSNSHSSNKLSDNSSDVSASSDTSNEGFSDDPISPSESNESSLDSIRNRNSVSDSSDETSDSTDADAVEDNPTYHHQRLYEKYSLDDIITLSSNLTKHEVLVLLFHFSMRFGLSSNAIEALLKLVNTILGNTLIPPQSYQFQNIFCPAKIISFHLYCPRCGTYVGPKDSFNGAPCTVCAADISESTNTASTNFFLQLFLTHQIKERLEKDGDKIINYRAERVVQPDKICDVFDGAVYSDLAEHGLSENDITVTINTDGAAVFGSSKNSMWPLQVRLNEIPPNERFSVENLMIAGLWFCRDEVQLSTYMVPFMKELQLLVTDGIDWYSPARGTMVNTKVYVSHCSVDTPAKAKMLNMIQFNGYNSCYVCLHPGNLFAVNQIRFSEETQYAERTNEDIRNDMLTAHESGVITRGFKEVSPLITLEYFTLPYSVVIDYMHSHLLGVTKTMWSNLWTNSAYSAEPYYLTPAKVKVIDRRLRALTPPSDISRDPRPLSLSAFWKANEWRAWILFYGPICLNGVLPRNYHNHFCLLSCALYLLNGREINRADINTIADYLSEFVRRHEYLYGLRNMTYSVHISKHLTKCVEYSGPLWSHSAFPYESGNGYLLTLIKGTMGVPQQIARKYATWFHLPKLLSLHPPVKAQVVEYCNSIVSFSRFKKFDAVQNVTIQGEKFKQRFIPSRNVEQLMRLKNLDTVDTFKISTIIFQASKFSSIKGKSRNDSVVKLSDGKFAQIFELFISETQPDILYVVVREIVISRKLHDTFKSQINVCAGYMYGDFRIITVEDIQDKCVMISLDKTNYIAELPNKFEKD